MDDSLDVTQATTSTAPIPSYRPDAKTRRYDRQLRLWASAGQRSLESARVLLVGCDASGCQTLKNLVLPGIAHFTILSSALTTARDVGTNFFLHPTSIGKPIAEQAVKYLKELNPAVEGSAQVSDVSDLLSSDPDFFTSFTLVVASNLVPAVELQIADLLWEASAAVGGPDIPLLAVRNSGFVGRIQVQLREHCINDTHPDTTHTLRIDTPFPALEEYARNLDLEKMDSMELSHIPWVVLLVRAVAQWKDAHNGEHPTSDDKDAFKGLIKGMMRKGDEENFEEALGQAYKAWNRSEVPWEIGQLLTDDNVKNVSSNSKNLHILLHTLSLYISTPPHLPPTSPALPDMHSSTQSYIALQNLYKQQSLADLARFTRLLQGVLEKVGLPADAIATEEVEGFVRNSGGVGIVKGRALREGKEGKGPFKEVIVDMFGDEDAEVPAPLGMHIALLASERFFAAHGRWPGTQAKKDMASDGREVEELATTIVKDCAPSVQELPESVIDSIAEVVRGGFGCLPTTAAFLGGVVAQEAIKLVTNQYTPLDGTVVVDLTKSVSERWAF